MADAGNPMDDVNKALDAANKYLDLYNKVVDQVVPWGTYQEAIQELERYKAQYSSAAAVLVGEVKTQLLNAQDDYHSSVQTIYNWCGYAVQILQIYVDLISPEDKRDVSADEKSLVLTTLDEGIAAMSLAIKSLESASKAFNETAGKLIELDTRFDADFSSKSAWYENEVDKLRKQAYGGAAAGIVLGPFGLAVSYSIAAGVVEGKLIPDLNRKLKDVRGYFTKLKNMINTSKQDIETTKQELKNEIDYIGELQMSAKTSKTVVYTLSLQLKKIIIDKVTVLITACNNYQVRHGKKG